MRDFDGKAEEFANNGAGRSGFDDFFLTSGTISVKVSSFVIVFMNWFCASRFLNNDAFSLILLFKITF